MRLPPLNSSLSKTPELTSQVSISRQSDWNLMNCRHLSLTDQQKFKHYGQGPRLAIPHSAIHHAIEAISYQMPNAIAAVHGSRTITYSDLNLKADQLAAELAASGIGHGNNVGLFVERSIEMLTGMLAILKTGAAYVPQDARISPAPLLDDIIDTADITTVLTLSHLKHKLPQHKNLSIMVLDQQETSPARISLTIPDRSTAKNDNCFILFTSGTTGKPNGVQVTHGNVCNILLSEPGNLGIKAGDRVAQLLNIAFDMAAWEILGCLSHGATLHIRNKDFTETARQCDVLIATPSILGKVDADQCRRVRAVAVAGEPCPRPLADKWANRCHFYNSCGPTETTIINTAQLYTPQSASLTIGKPTPNNRVYVLNDQLQPCAIGEVGELWAGGDGVTAGYVNNPELTAERYRPDPFSNDGSLMFRTRDLGRWNNQGELEHFGRTDDQVKVKGFRVELDSVSAQIEQVDGCDQAVTLKLDDKNLVSFVQPEHIDIDACIEAIENALPYYCKPTAIFSLNQLPLTARGKVDKRQLLDLAKSSMTDSITISEGVAQ